MNDLRIEYGIGGAISLGQMYGRPGLPSGGPISLGHFYGKANVSFNPNGGNIGFAGIGSAQGYIYCSQPAVWTYSASGNTGALTVSVPSGGTASEIFFFLNGRAGNNNVQRNVQVSLTGSAGGVARSFIVFLDTDG